MPDRRDQTPSSRMSARVSWCSLLRTVRAPLGLLVMAAVGLLFPPQTSDMLASLDDGGGDTVRFHLALALLALSSWYWSRTLLAARFDVPDNRTARKALANWGAGDIDMVAYNRIPRMMFVLSVLLGFGMNLRTGAYQNVLYLILWALPLGTLIVFRTDLERRLFHSLGKPGLTGAELQPGDGPRKSARLCCWIKSIPSRLRYLVRRAPWPNRVSIVFILFSLFTFSWGTLETFTPDWLWPGAVNLPMVASFLLPGPSVVVFALAMMIAPLSLLTFLFDGLDISQSWGGFTVLRRPPVVSVLLIWVLVTPWWYCLHAVRIVQPSMATMGPASRQDLGTLFGSWADSCVGAPQAAGQPIRPIIVAISGGATMAAIWGERVLFQIEMDTGQDSPRIFAVSSVSGGSLGVAAYMSSLAAMNDRARCHDDKTRHDRMKILASPTLSHDALGPLLGGALLADVPRAIFAPFITSIFGAERGRDRAADLELGFSRLWRQTARSDPKYPVVRFEDPYLSLLYEREVTPDGDLLWRPRSGMPLWLANGTDVSTGNRIITAPFNPCISWPFPAAEDALASLHADVPISTAIDNTSRFPYLSPSGEMLAAEAPVENCFCQGDQQDPQGDSSREIEDGGYFDNSGLQTAIDLASWISREGSKFLPKRLQGSAIEPIIVAATADGEVTNSQTIVRCGTLYDDPTAISPVHRPAQMLSPALGLYTSRSGHAAILIREVRSEFCGNIDRKDAKTISLPGLTGFGVASVSTQQSFFHFYLAADNKIPIPLNWVLSRKMDRFIWEDSICQSGNLDEAWLMRKSLMKTNTNELQLKMLQDKERRQCNNWFLAQK